MKDEKKINGSEFEEIDPYLLKVSRSVCKIRAETHFGSGFFLKYSIGDVKFFCLVSNEHVITENMINNKDKIYIYYDNEFENFILDLDEKERYIKRFKQINIDATVVQILPKDNISEVYFLSPEETFIKNQLNGKQIYIPQYPSAGRLKNARGIIKSINEDEFIHLVSTESGSSGSPIFLKDSLKIIGIHKARSEEKEENYGNLISPIFKIIKDEIFLINNFIERNKNNKNNNENNTKKYVSKSMRRIENEIKAINKSGDNFYIKPFDEDIYNCIATIRGPISSPYEGGLFKLRIIFPDNYPFKAPDIQFITKIYHPNINPNGHICSCVLNEYIYNSWDPTHKVESILSFIQSFIKTVLCYTCVQGNQEALSLYFNDKNRFESIARQWTQLYAK